ncbi:hypothetical protein ACLOJK_021559 [Asimina triloba]
MGRAIISSTHLPLKFSKPLPASSPNPKLLPLTNALGLRRMLPSSTTQFSAKAVLSESPYAKKFAKIGAQSTGPVPAKQLLEAAEKAAKTGAEKGRLAAPKSRAITAKIYSEAQRQYNQGGVVTVSIREVHLIRGRTRWKLVDGTTNFAHGYPSFAVSVGVLFQGRPAAAAVVEVPFVERSLLVTGFGYDHDDAWAANINLFKEFTDVSRGVRRLGAAAVDMCHVALGIVEAYWEYRLKPWDMAAGTLMVEEAGGVVTCMDGKNFSVFDRSVLVSNGLLHEKLLERIGPATEQLKNKGIDFSLWFKPENYSTDF